MAARSFSLFTCLALCGCVAAGPATPAASRATVMLDNRLSSCLQVHGEQTLAAPARLAFDYTLNGSLADCGCKSAFASYRVQAGNGDPAEILMEDRVRLDGRNRIELALTAGTPLPTGRELQLVLGCARPD